MREADLEKHLSSGQGAEVKNEELEKAREEARKRLEEESKKPISERRLPEFGSDKDFQLQQALNQLKGQPVKVSKTLVERKIEDKSADTGTADKKATDKKTTDKAPEKSNTDKPKK